MNRFRIGAAVAVAGAVAIVATWSPAAAGQAQSRDRSSEARVFQLARGQSGRIGVSIRDIDPARDKASAGVVIEDVEGESPAAKAGLKAGDVVVEYDGERVRSTRQFTRLVQESVPGRSVPVVVLRDGQRTTLNVEPASGGTFRFWSGAGDGVFAIPPTPPVPPAAPAPPAPPMDLLPEVYGRFERFMGGSGRLGVAVQGLSPQLAEYFGAKDGVLVTSVTDDSPAQKAGVKAGDVITALNGERITSVAELRREVQRLDNDAEFTLEVLRDKKAMTLKGKVEARQPRGRAITI
jgi:serine protease Do